ncbi:MAG: hypothetical protein EOP89_07955, partial [Lysobacteraceae bacterium]
MLQLEVAEDYSVASKDALKGVQVRNTAKSGQLTLQSPYVCQTIDVFVDLVLRNPQRSVSLYYLTTSDIATERELIHRVAGGAGLAYWRRAAAGAEVGPLRARIMSLKLADATAAYLDALSDDHFRTEFLQRIYWHCSAPDLSEVRSELEAGLIEYASTARSLSSQTARGLMPLVIERVFMTAVSKG